MPSCPKCNAELVAHQAFCERCGIQLKAGIERKKLPEHLESLISPLHEKHVRSARVAIMVVAIITVVASIALWFMLQSEIERVRANPLSLLDDQAVAMSKVTIASSFLLGMLFFGLFVWAKSNPFGASLTALVVYLTSILVSAALDPSSFAKGIIVKVIIVLALFKGVQAGLAFKKLEPRTERRGPG